MFEISAFSVDLDGAVFNGREAGEGLPVVFLHAGVCDWRMWERQMEAVAAAGYRAVAYDRRGYGETTSPDEEFNHLDDLEDVLDALGIHAAIFVGCSMGGGLAIDFALDNPERTAGLVLIGTSVTGSPEPDIEEEIEPLLAALDDAAEREDWDTVNKIHAHAWLDGPLSKNGRVAGEARALFMDMNSKALAKLAGLTLEEEREPALDSIEDVTAPVLLIVGDLDFPYIIERHNDLSEEFENGFAVVLEGAAHLPSLERPDLVNPLLLEFLQTIAGGPDA
jgi:pimeloyl-ACP methyl ester carboxylesterase